MDAKSRTIRTLLLMVLLAPATGVMAGDLSAVINGKSFHVGSDKDWNENNVGLGVEYQFATKSRWKTLLIAGGFRDSEENLSYMAGAGVHRNIYSSHRLDGLYVDIGLNVFLMTREYVNDGRPFPGALPSLSVGNRLVGANLTYVPRAALEDLYSRGAMDKSLRGIVFLQVKFNLTALTRTD